MGGIDARAGLASRQNGQSGYLTIDLGALVRNYDQLSSVVASAKAAAVVKADAYGLGARQVANALYERGCRDFFVAQLPEALILREFIADDADLYVLNGLQPGDEITCAEANIVPVINSLPQWHQWSRAASSAKRRLPAVLQFDTGMSRLGLPPCEQVQLAGLIVASDVEVRFIMSHLACADELDSVQNADQLLEMRRLADAFLGLDVSFANSGGAFLGRSYHGALTRPGIALYGGAPSAGTKNPMEPVVSLDVAVVQTRIVPSGTKVGYGGAFVTPREMRLATIGAGYADGLPRSLSDRGAVFYDGVRLPIVGRVSMDSITVDISGLPATAIGHGTLVEVLGPNQSLEDLARDAGTISYEILTGLGSRYHRQYR
ncbi:alanine racemase [Rhizobium grahamii]|uniref:Alanine racemase n=1 Tax=Rhizobium grahamii TaxID=1120045 RepID=A0A370KI79_9HYPH|nr:alanine racemase [Rhizobium grahamii]RDJ05600.1 alanine racemase [Rhizobium grahamii]